MKFLLLILLGISSAFAFGQTDVELWSGADISTQINKKIKVGLEAQARFDESISRTKSIFLAPAVKYDPFKHVRVGGEFRWMSIPYSNEIENRIAAYRYGIDVEVRKIMGFLKDKSRIDLDFRLRGTLAKEKHKRDDATLRYRIKGSYNLPKTKLEPHVSFELFHHLNDQIIYTFDAVRTTHVINKYRIRLGAEYPLKKQHKVTAFLLYQSQFHSLKNDFVIGLGYSFELKLDKK